VWRAFNSVSHFGERPPVKMRRGTGEWLVRLLIQRYRELLAMLRMIAGGQKALFLLPGTVIV